MDGAGSKPISVIIEMVPSRLPIRPTPAFYHRYFGLRIEDALRIRDLRGYGFPAFLRRFEMLVIIEVPPLRNSTDVCAAPSAGAQRASTGGSGCPRSYLPYARRATRAGRRKV